MDEFDAIMEYRNKVFRWAKDKADSINEAKERIQAASEKYLDMNKKLMELDRILQNIDRDRWIRERREE